MFDEWVTIPEAVEQTGVSESTIQRLLRRQEIEKAWRKVPGRKDVIVVDPDRIKALKEKPKHPAVDTETTAIISKPSMNSVKVSGLGSDAMTLLMALQAPPFLLSVPHAAALSGLSVYNIRQACKEKRLPAFKSRGYRILREDLWHYVHSLVEA